MTTVLWRRFGTAARPVPEPLPTPFAWAAACLGALVVVLALTVAGGLRHPAVALAVFCVLAALLGLRARAVAAPGTALVCWMFYNGFAIYPQGQLSWDGGNDAYRLGLLLAVSLLGSVVAHVVHARRAYRRVTPNAELRDTLE